MTEYFTNLILLMIMMMMIYHISAFIEYYFVAPNDKCVGECKYVPRNLSLGYPAKDSWCTDLTSGANTKCWAIDCSTDCYPTESPQNNYITLRSMPGSEFGDTLYTEFQRSNKNGHPVDFAKVDYHEFYDVSSDKWQMSNIYATTPTAKLARLHNELRTFYTCSGDTCP